MEKNQKLSFIKSIDSEKKRVTGYVSTFSWDRDMERFVKGAWELDNYRKNPVVLWGHESWNPPIGKNVDLREDDLGLIATTEFDNQSEKAVHVFSLMERGFLNTFSVGFMRKEFQMEDAGQGEKGLAITKAELFEYSVVSVPANPGALVGREIAELAIKVLGPKSIEKLETKSMGEQFLVLPLGPDDPSEPSNQEPIGEPPVKEDSIELEPALKHVMELAKMAKGNPLPEKQRILLTSAVSVFNEILEERKEPYNPSELLNLKDALAALAGVAAGAYPEVAPMINKTISQIDKAITGRME